MATLRPTVSLGDARPILAAIKTVPIPVHPHMAEPERAVLPFLTISRQPGAGAWTLARALVERLNDVEPGDPPWTCWDRELVEKIAADCHVSQQLIDSLEESSHNWLADFFSGMSLDEQRTDELAIFHRVAQTIRALAQVGRVVIVGRGGAYLTRNMPGGIHIRLIAPFEHRVSNMQRQWNVARHVAAARVLEIERNREAFLKRYFPNVQRSPEMFAMQLNTAEISEQQLADVIMPLLTGRSRGGL